MLYLLAGFCLMMPGTEVNAGSASGSLDIQTMVEPSLSYQILDEPHHLKVTKKDLGDDDEHKKKYGKKYKKKYDKKYEGREKTVKNGTVISIRTNNPNGYILVIQAHMSAVFRHVEVKVEGDGSSVKLYPGNRVELHMPFAGPGEDVKKLSYKFRLSSDIEKGKYPWPISVTAYLM